VWIGTGAKNSLVHVSLPADRARSIDRTLYLPGKQFWAYGIARDPHSMRLAVAGVSYGAVVISDESVSRIQHVIPVGKHPAQLAWSPDGKRLYVTLWGERSVGVIDPDRGRLVRKIAVGLHPEALAPTRDGSHLYVANEDDDTVSAIDAITARVKETFRLNLFGSRLVGLSPTALALSSDERRLYVVCAAANAIVVLDLRNGMHVLGAVPTGWYPTDLAVDEGLNRLVVIDGKGEGSDANPNYHPFETIGLSKAGHVALELSGYLGYNLVGSVRTIPLPTDADLVASTAQVQANAAPSLRAAVEQPGAILHGPAPANDVEADGRKTLLKGGPIRHVLFIIKENRTYDQVLGDVSAGDGDSSLAAFGRNITPNEHAIATRFGLFDRAFTDSQVSQDGHVWLTAAFANDYLEKTWPPLYGGRFDEGDSGDPYDPYQTHEGYLWAAAARAHISYRSYGEYCDADPKHKGLYRADDRGLVGHIDPHFPSFDVTIKDSVRVAEWRREFRQYEANGSLPAMTWMWLPGDHTAGTRPGMRTPRAMVAENDAAVGSVVDAISHSRYWANTAIFIIEDDAQNGPDHVDEQRTTLYVVSPYARPGTHHERYTQSSVNRTIELILGLAPLSTYDAGARPLYAAFQSRPDLRPYDAMPAKIDLDERNAKTAYRASDSDRIDFAKPDQAAEGATERRRDRSSPDAAIVGTAPSTKTL
jgi:YVTN family beta-propeller protein